jgi:hypothetical protein
MEFRQIKIPVLSPDLFAIKNSLMASQSRHICVEFAPVNPKRRSVPSASLVTAA